MDRAQRKTIIPLVLIFVIINALLTIFNARLRQKGIDAGVILVANLLFFLVNLLVFFRQTKAMANSNPNVFVRTVMAGMMIKMLVCVTAVITYILVAGKADFNKPAVYFSLGLYIVYLVTEVAMMTKLNKSKHG